LAVEFVELEEALALGKMMAASISLAWVLNIAVHQVKRVGKDL